MLRILTIALAFASAAAFGMNVSNVTTGSTAAPTAGAGYTARKGMPIGGTANMMRGAKGYTNAKCKGKCDTTKRCFSYVFNPSNGGYCELWSRGLKSAGASWDIRSGCSSGCMKTARGRDAGSSLYLKSAAFKSPPSQSPTAAAPTSRPTGRASYCTVIPAKVCKYCGDFCKLKGLCTPIGGQLDSLKRCMISGRQRECCKYVTQAPTPTPTTTPKFCEVLKGKSCEARRRVSSTRYRTLNTATAGCMGNAKCKGVYAVN